MNKIEFFNNCNVISLQDKSEEWLLNRKKGIGGSDVAAILGVSKYKTPHDLYTEKKNNTVQHITNEAIEKGNRMEAPLIDLFFAKYKNYQKINTKDISLTSKKYDFMKASLDSAFIDEVGHKCVLETKTTTIQNAKMRKEWGYYDDYKEEYIELIPQQYYCQALHYLIVTGFQKVIVYAHIDYAYKDDSEVLTRVVNREDVLSDIEYIIQKEKKFWDDFENNITPPFIGRY
jgi:putative phage-type endonuclease